MNIISSTDIIVERIVPVNKGNLRAYCNVRMPGGMGISSIRVVQQPGQEPWVSMPQNEWLDVNGKKRYSPIVELPPGLKEAVSTSVLAAWATFVQGGGR